jgi:uncharacterized protein YbjT (DUF2867 family)
VNANSGKPTGITFFEELEQSMKIVVNTPTGNIGRAVADRLLDTDHEVILMARDPKKIHHFAERGAKVYTGHLEDETFVVEATEGADLLFWNTPPNYTTDDMRAFQQRLGEIAALAVSSNSIGRVVNISSIGAQNSDGAGPISGLHTVENILNQTEANVTSLRPTFFMENYYFSMQTIAADGNIYMPLPGEIGFPMIATRDIAALAVERILDQSWTGASVIELVGPNEVTCDDAAEILGKTLGKNVSHVFVSNEQAKAAMIGMGMSDSVADVMLEMYGAMRERKIVPVETPKVTATTFDQFAQEIYHPAFAGAAEA